VRVEIKDDGTLHVTLSRRNLLTLLTKLNGHPPGSKCTIVAPNIYPCTLVTAEEDAVHYARAERLGFGPGVMHPDTEVRLP
jgi:hypothetical protein